MSSLGPSEIFLFKDFRLDRRGLFRRDQGGYLPGLRFLDPSEKGPSGHVRLPSMSGQRRSEFGGVLVASAAATRDEAVPKNLEKICLIAGRAFFAWPRYALVAVRRLP